MLASLLAALLLSAPDARAQNQAPNQTAGQATTVKRYRRGRNAQSDDADINTHLKALSCPKGFRAVKTSGPHLTPTRSASSSAVLGRKKSAKEAHATAATAFGRRCVPATPAKADKPASEAAQAAPETATLGR
jgi:hypothetical protein